MRRRIATVLGAVALLAVASYDPPMTGWALSTRDTAAASRPSGATTQRASSPQAAGTDERGRASSVRTARSEAPRRRRGPDRRVLRLVSTSGVPHADVGDLRRSRYWRPGMPQGTNAHWFRYLRRQVDHITRGADVVLHQGDKVEGRWGLDITGSGVFGPVDTPAARRAAVREAGDTYYSWLNAFWSGTRVLWAVGDHEIGDLPATGVEPPGSVAHEAHEVYVDVWKQHHGGRTQYATRIGDVGIVTLFPFEKDAGGVSARLSASDLDWMRRRVAALRRAGARWVIVQSEIPAIGPNAGQGTSGLLLSNGSQVWRALRHLDVDLFLAAEFHVETTRTDRGTTPLHIVHGRASQGDAGYLVIDVYDGRSARLELRMRRLPGRRTGTAALWATGAKRAHRTPVSSGRSRVIGRATVWPDGRVTDRRGVLREAVDTMATVAGQRG